MKIRQEADFYGAMDGATKFVKGDAIASIIIVIIDIIGGLIIGALQHGMPLAEAGRVYVLLTVGDGLVSQIPALMLSTATGLVVTRAASSDMNMGEEMTRQLTAQPKALFVSAAVLLLLALVPGLPAGPFLGLALFIGLIAYLLNKQSELVVEEELVEEDLQQIRAPLAEELNDLVKVDPLEVEVGYNLISLVLPEQEGIFWTGWPW